MKSGTQAPRHRLTQPRPVVSRWLLSALLLLMSTLLVACGGGGGGSSDSGSVSTSSVGGTVSKGPVEGANIALYRAGADGGPVGDPVATGITTDADGAWSGTIPQGLPRPLVVISTGGSYTDEATGNPVDLDGRSLRSYLPEGADSVAVTPLTELLVQVTQEKIAAGTDVSIDAALDEARDVLSSVLGVSFDPLTTQPLAMDKAGDGDRDQRAYTAILAGLSQLAKTLAPTADPFSMVQALIEDMSDGTLDGEKDGVPVTVNIEGNDTNLNVLDDDGIQGSDLIAAINSAITGNATFNDVAVSDDGEGNVVVSPRYTLGGTVNGLLGSGLVLQENMLELLIESSDDFTFSGFFDAGFEYSVIVKTQPTGPMQTCSVSNGVGTVTEDVGGIVVNCVTDTFTVGGNVSGLEADESLILQNNGTDSLLVTDNVGFVFETPVEDETPYNVTILTQPDNGQICGVINGSGNVDGAAIANVEVHCDLIAVSMGVINGSFSTQTSQVADGTLALLIQPEPGYVLDVGSVGVTGVGCSGVLESNIYTVTLGSETCTVTAEFEEAPLGSGFWGIFNWGEAIWQ